MTIYHISEFGKDWNVNPNMLDEMVTNTVWYRAELNYKVKFKIWYPNVLFSDIMYLSDKR